MFTIFCSPQIVTIIIGTSLFYLLIVGIAYAYRYRTLTGKPVTAQAATGGHALLGVASTPPLPLLSSVRSSQTFQELPELPEEYDAFETAFPDEDIPFFEEQPMTLLKEAERVVEEIQAVVDHIVSRPANPDEVFTKIQAIICDYSFFFDTEYYDAINRFVAVTVQRDCDLQLAEEDLKALWYAAAA